MGMMYTTAVHEIMHAIGFSGGEVSYFRDSSGNPFTAKSGGKITRAFSNPSRTKATVPTP